jgi:P27 family predicted phage terminase small subunit
MKRHAPPKAPDGLSDDSRRFWQRILAEYTIDDAAGLRILQVACEALDTARAAQEQVDKDGMVLDDRYGHKANPACAILRDARSQFLMAMKTLGLPTTQDE